MPITNNLIKIDDVPLRPSPKFNINYETFKSGEYIIGGLLKISINGEIYAGSAEDLTSKITDLSAYSATCRTIYIECDGTILVNGNGFIRSLTFNPTDQPFMVNYSFEIEVSTTESTLSIKRDADFDDIYNLSIPSNIILKSYEESLLLASDESLSNTFFYVDNSYTKASLKLSGQISIQAYHHMCETFDSPDLVNRLFTILDGRMNQILALNNSLSKAYPVLESYLDGQYTAINDNKNISINKFDNKIDIRFDLYVIAGTCNPKAMVDITLTENTDQATALSTWSLKGSIKGLADRSSNTLHNNVLNNSKAVNAGLVYNNIENDISSRNYSQTSIFGCLAPASFPANTTCIQRVSSQITDNFNGAQIDFDITYGDIEQCQIGGTNIEINIQEEHSTKRYVEHIIPGRVNPIIQVGANLTPYKVTITASGKLNSCDTSLLETLKNCVFARFQDTIFDRAYDNYLLVKETETTGKYSYKISRSYIECI